MMHLRCLLDSLALVTELVEAMLLLLECMLQLRDSLPGHQIVLANSLLVWRHHRVHHRGMRQLLGSATLLGDTELLLLRSKVLLESSTQLHGRMPLGCKLGCVLGEA